MNTTNYKTVAQIVSDNNWITSEGAFRQIIYNADKNGAHVFIKRVGRRVLIDQNMLDRWILGGGTTRLPAFKAKEKDDEI